MIICIEWELSQYLPMKTFLDFPEFSGLVFFKKNNEKLISLLKGKKKSENIISSNLLQRNFFSSLSTLSCLRYGSQYQSGNIWPKEIKSGGMIIWWMVCPYRLVIAIINPTEKLPSTLLSEISLKEKGVVASPASLRHWACAVATGCHKDSRCCLGQNLVSEVLRFIAYDAFAHTLFHWIQTAIFLGL